MAGFPKPSEDYFQKRLDPKELLEQNPATTFYMRISGNTWKRHGIVDKDFLVIDRSLEPSHGKMAVVTYMGDFSIRRIGKIQGRLCFLELDEKANIVPVELESDVQIWGIITFVIHRCK
ncbi:S24 family peptidase [Leptospira johnsonii]|nr:S24 family peptidase [Leptospira johnsonii]